jgi:hypothetical protein
MNDFSLFQLVPQLGLGRLPPAVFPPNFVDGGKYQAWFEPLQVYWQFSFELFGCKH